MLGVVWFVYGSDGGFELVWGFIFIFKNKVFGGVVVDV